MSKRTAFCVVLVAVGVVGACAQLDHLIKNGGGTSSASAATLWSIDWDGDGGFEKKTVTWTVETTDEVAGDMQLKQETNFGREEFLLHYDVASNGQLLMSIASVAGGKGYANIWTGTFEGGVFKRSQVTFGNNLDVTPTYAPGEQEIVFSTNRFNGMFTICRQPLGGIGGIKVGQGGLANDFGPQIHKDTKKMLFARVRPGSLSGSLCARAIEGSASTEEFCEGFEPRWSRDGKTMLYTAVNRSTGLMQLWTRSTSSTEATQVPHGGFGCNNMNPCWSPDETRIVFASDRSTDSQGKRNFDIWLINADGTGDAQPLTSSGAYDDMPQWLDSETILFRSNRGDLWNIWSVKLSTSGN